MDEEEKTFGKWKSLITWFAKNQIKLFFFSFQSLSFLQYASYGLLNILAKDFSLVVIKIENSFISQLSQRLNCDSHLECHYNLNVGRMERKLLINTNSL